MICLFGLWKLADSVCWCRGSHREALWGFYADRSPPVATRPRRQSDGFDFQLFLISASVRRKTVPAMKYSAAPIRVESASSGSTASECFLFFLVAFCFFFPVLGSKQVGTDISLCVFGRSESTCCFRFGWMRTQTLVQRTVMWSWPASPRIKAETMKWKTCRLCVI